jgi:hypothetical protein
MYAGAALATVVGVGVLLKACYKRCPSNKVRGEGKRGKEGEGDKKRI